MRSETQTASKKLKSEAVPAKKDYSKQIKRALMLKEQIDELNAEFKELKEFFLDEFNTNKSEEFFLTSVGAVRLKTTNSYECDPTAISDLKKIFKENYAGFVNEKITYGVSASLKKLLQDADYKHSSTIRNAVIIKTSHSVNFEPLKG